jgi:uncharacterized protein YjiS (DUF1127 family)
VALLQLVEKKPMNAHLTTNAYPMLTPKAGDDYFSSISRYLGAWAVRAIDSILERIERVQDRSALARMDDRELKDIGLTRTDIEGATRGPGASA